MAEPDRQTVQIFIINRPLQALIVIFEMSGPVFAGLFLSGDPTSMLVSQDATDLERETLRFDPSIRVQYALSRPDAAGRFRSQPPGRANDDGADLATRAGNLGAGDCRNDAGAGDRRAAGELGRVVP